MKPSVLRTLELLIATARAGERCPTRSALGAAKSDHITRLAHTGYVRIEVYGRNFRVVCILKGEHAGCATKSPDEGGSPYLVLDSAGTHRGRSSADLVIEALQRPAPDVDPLLAALRAARRTP